MRQWSRRDVHRRRGSAEGERKSLHARIEKLDIELSVSDGLRLSDQLVQPRCGHRAVAVVVYVHAVRSARGLSIDAYAKPHRRAACCRPHDEMQIAGVKAVHDPPVGRVQHRGLFPYRPLTCKRPMIAPQRRGGGIHTTLVQRRTARRRKMFGAFQADIIFRRLQAAPIGGRFQTGPAHMTQDIYGKKFFPTPLNRCR